MTDEAKIVIYGAEWCAFCHEAMRYLDKLGVKYIYKNVDHSLEDARAAVQKSGQTGIPVLDVAGTIIVGFDRPRLDDALHKAKLTT